jgi:hypothetical protein
MSAGSGSGEAASGLKLGRVAEASVRRASLRKPQPKGAGKVAVAKKTTVRKGDAKGSIAPALEQKDRENEEVCGCGRYDKDGYACAQTGHAQGSPEPLRPTRVQGSQGFRLRSARRLWVNNRHVRVRAGPLRSRLPPGHALKCAVLGSSTWRMLDPSSSPPPPAACPRLSAVVCYQRPRVRM